MTRHLHTGCETPISASGVNETNVDGDRRITVTGELDLVSASRLSELCSSPADADVGNVLLDLSGVTFVDSSGIHALISAYEIYSNQLRIIASLEVLRMVDLCGLRDSLPLAEAEA
jgi:anti-anti-sigma factor